MCLPKTREECMKRTLPETRTVCEDVTEEVCNPVQEIECEDVPTKQCVDKKSLRTEQKCGTKPEKVCKQVPKTVVRPENVLRPVEECQDVDDTECMLMKVWQKVPMNSTECSTFVEDVCRVVDKPKEVEECKDELVDECKPVSKKHVKIVEENVCKDVLVDVNETICDGDDSSNDGNGNNGEDGDDSNSNNGGDDDGKNISGKKENNDSGDKGINKNTGNDSEEDIDSNNVDTYGPPKAPLYTPNPSNGNEDSGNDEDSKTDDGNKGNGSNDSTNNNGDGDNKDNTDNGNKGDGDNGKNTGGKCREVARKKVETVCKLEPKEVIEWKEEEACAKMPKNLCKLVTKIIPTKVGSSIVPSTMGTLWQQKFFLFKFSIYFKVCGPEEVKKCRWVIRNVNKQVDEKVCTDVVREVSFLFLGTLSSNLVCTPRSARRCRGGWWRRCRGRSRRRSAPSSQPPSARTSRWT